MMYILLSLSFASLSETRVQFIEPAPPQREIFSIDSDCGVHNIKIIYETNLYPKKDFVISITTNGNKFRSSIISNINRKIAGYDIEKIFVHNCNLESNSKLALMRIVANPISHKSTEKIVLTYWLHNGYVTAE